MYGLPLENLLEFPHNNNNESDGGWQEPLWGFGVGACSSKLGGGRSKMRESRRWFASKTRHFNLPATLATQILPSTWIKEGGRMNRKNPPI